MDLVEGGVSKFASNYTILRANILLNFSSIDMNSYMKIKIFLLTCTQRSVPNPLGI